MTAGNAVWNGAPGERRRRRDDQDDLAGSWKHVETLNPKPGRAWKDNGISEAQTLNAKHYALNPKP